MHLRSPTLLVLAGVALSCVFLNISAFLQPSFAAVMQSLARWRQLHSAQTSTMDLTANVTRWRRIRIHKQADNTRLYSLIIDYLKDPALAHSVKELVIRCNVPQESYLSSKHIPHQRIENEKSRDISSNVSLLEAVKALDVGDAASEWVRALSWMSPELVEARAAENDWEAGLFYHRQDALFRNYAAAVLIKLCPNIEKLKFEDPYTTDILTTVLRKNNHDLLPGIYLQKLKHVKLLPMSHSIIGDRRFYTTMDFLGLVGLFNRLPLLESIGVDGIEEDNRGSGRWLIAPHTSNVKSIQISHSDFSSAILASIIRLPRALEEFTYSTGGRGIVDGNPIVYPKTLGKALLCHKGSLRKVDVDMDARIHEIPEIYGNEDGTDPNDPCDLESVAYIRNEWFLLNEADSSGPLFTKDLPDTREYSGTLGSLHDFTALTDLSVGVTLLLGPGEAAPFRLIDALPPNLESLVLRGYRKGAKQSHDKHIDELLHMRLEKFPFLRDIRGIDTLIPNGEDVDDPDNNEDELWMPPDDNDDWEEERLPSSTSSRLLSADS